MLSSWGVPFRATDVEAEPEARRDLERLAIPLVPAVVVGDRAVHGWNPKGVAELLGVTYLDGPRLEPAELAQRLDRILVVAEHAVGQLSPAHLQLTAVPGRDRSLRQLAYHLFRVSLAFQKAMETRQYPEAWLLEAAPPELTDAQAIVRYGRTVRERVRQWLARPEGCAGEVDTYYGRQTAHELLERTVWHVAQHVRQLHARLAELGIRPEVPLTAADLRDLPLPREVW